MAMSRMRSARSAKPPAPRPKLTLLTLSHYFSFMSTQIFPERSFARAFQGERQFMKKSAARNMLSAGAEGSARPWARKSRREEGKSSRRCGEEPLDLPGPEGPRRLGARFSDDLARAHRASRRLQRSGARGFPGAGDRAAAKAAEAIARRTPYAPPSRHCALSI